MNSHEENMTNTVKNAFDGVAKIYAETSFLLKDFSDEITKLGFSSMMSGSSIGTSTSKSIDRPKEWQARYASLFFKPDDPAGNERFICITAIYCNYDGESIEPYLLAGVMETDWEYYIQYNRYLDNIDAFKGNDGQMIELPGTGSIIAQPLLRIKPEEVKDLAKRISDRWEEKYGKLHNS